MKPEEINRALAEKVMGWTIRDTKRLYYYESAFLVSDWDPYHRIDHAMMCLEKFSDYRIEKRTWDDGKINYQCSLMGREFKSDWVDTAPAAICIAALKAVDEIRDGGKLDEEI